MARHLNFEAEGCVKASHEIYRDTAPYAGGKIARYYLAVTKQERITLPVSEELGRPEHHEGRWVSLAA